MSLINTEYERLSQVVKLGKSYLIVPSLLSDAVGSGQRTLFFVCNFSATTFWFGGQARIGAVVSLAENTKKKKKPPSKTRYWDNLYLKKLESQLTFQN